MIKLTWGHLRDREMMNSFGKLYGQPMGYDVGMKFALLGREIKKQQKICDETHLGILKKYGTEDKEKPGVYQLKDATRTEYAAEMKKLDETEFTVRISKFDASELSKVVQFSPQDLMLLEPILLPLEEAKEGSTDPKLKAVPAEQPAPTAH